MVQEVVSGCVRYVELHAPSSTIFDPCVFCMLAVVGNSGMANDPNVSQGDGRGREETRITKNSLALASFGR